MENTKPIEKNDKKQAEKFNRMADLLGCYLYNPNLYACNQKESRYGKIIDEKNAFI